MKTKTKPGQFKRRASYYAKKYRETNEQLEATKKDLALAIAERDRNIAVRRFLLSVGVERQNDYGRGETFMLCYQVHEETLRQVRDVETFITGTATMLAEKMMREWQEKRNP